MTVVFIILGALLLVYALVWAYLISGYLRNQRAAVKGFLDAWERDDYEVKAGNAWETNRPALSIVYRQGHSNRTFSIDQDGRMISDIKWSQEGRRTVTPSRYSRKRIESITQQIATMARLEGKLDEWLDDGAEGQSI